MKNKRMSPDYRKKIIFNADDFGFSSSVNEAVISAAEFGTVRAASLMVTMPFAESAAALTLKRCPNLDIGLHFSLTCGKSVASPEKVPLLVDMQGCFCLGFIGLMRLLNSKKRNEAIREIQYELNAQFDRIDYLQRQYHFRLTHLDSHQHVHVLSGIFETIYDKSQEKNLHLRIPRERFGGMKRFFRRFYSWFPAGILKKEILNRNLRQYACHSDTTIGYFGILDSGKIDEKALNVIFHAVKREDKGEYFEINLHPSYFIKNCCVPNEVERIISQDELRFHSSPWREKELKTLTNNQVFQLLKCYHLDLSGFPLRHVTD